jgi:diguanylate cyclase (GGDEF)-like protein
VYTRAYSVVSDRHLAVLNILAEHATAAIQNARRDTERQELAFTDALTQLVNSRGLFRKLEELTPQEGSPAESFGLVMLDLDEFKQVNDRYGHLRGDELLVAVSETMRRVCRPHDTVCRYAGDEFVIIQMGADPKRLDDLCSRLRSELSKIRFEGCEFNVLGSMGYAVYPVDGQDARTLLHHADQRMYQDKFARKSALPGNVIRSIEPLPSAALKPESLKPAAVA